MTVKKIVAQLLSCVSELARQGVIDDDDRAELKELIFSHDPRLCSTSLHEQGLSSGRGVMQPRYEPRPHAQVDPLTDGFLLPKPCALTFQEDVPRQVRRRLLAVLQSTEANAAAEQIDLQDQEGVWV